MWPCIWSLPCGRKNKQWGSSFFSWLLKEHASISKTITALYIFTLQKYCSPLYTSAFCLCLKVSCPSKYFSEISSGRQDKAQPAMPVLAANASLWVEWRRMVICLVEHTLFSTLEGGMSAVSFLHSSFLQVINAVMLWPVHVQKVPQASEHLCPAKLQTRCDICCACQSIWLFIPTDSSMLRTVDPQKSL